MKSVWQLETPLPSFPAPKSDMEVEAAVVGGGLAGLLTAYKLREKGVDAAIFEAAGICSGQTANTTAKITCQHSLIYDRLITAFGEKKAAQYARANSLAIGEYERIALSEKIECAFERLPAYLYTCGGSEPLNKEYEAAKKLGIAARLLDCTPLPLKITKALSFDNQAQFNPLAFAAGIAPKLRIFENAPVEKVEKNILKICDVKIRAKHIVIASHYPFINAPGFYFLKMHQARAYAAAFENCKDIDGMYFGIDPGALSLRNHGRLLIAAGCSHKTGESSGGEFSIIETKTKAIFPKAVRIAEWSAQDCMTPDSVPYIGRYSSGNENIYVATGFGKWGITSSMVSAEIISDMICGIENKNAEIFSPQRSNQAAATCLLRHSMRSVEWLALKKLKIPPKTVSTLKNGEGSVVEYNGSPAAVYKDESGIIHAVSANCSHLGCRLTFNSELKSWDCPCHGSRFDIDGRLLDNPAQLNLEKR